MFGLKKVLVENQDANKATRKNLPYSQHCVCVCVYIYKHVMWSCNRNTAW